VLREAVMEESQAHPAAKWVDKRTKYQLSTRRTFRDWRTGRGLRSHGRKIIVDTYGGYAPTAAARSGQGSLQGRSLASYAVPLFAKKHRSAGLAERCEVQS